MSAGREVDVFADRHEAEGETLSQAITAAASEELEAESCVLLGYLCGIVVGLKYYAGVVNQGEMVGLVREPQNPYDHNAVMVTNIYGSQVGHIKKDLAVAMANIMDNNVAKIEGVVFSGTKNNLTMPVMLSFWGQQEKKQSLTELIARQGYKLNLLGNSQSGRLKLVNDWKQTKKNKKARFYSDYLSEQPALCLIADPISKLHSGAGAHVHSFNKEVTIKLTAAELKNAFDNLFEGLMESKDGEKEAAESVCTPLLPHQKQALSWMCARENKSALPPFWEKRGEMYFNSLTGFSAKEVPERVRGGLLADDMGLGKTLTTIALILTNFHEGKPLPVDDRENLTTLFKAKNTPHTDSKPEGGGIDVQSGSSSSDIVTMVDVPDVETADETEKNRSKEKMKPTKHQLNKVLHDDLDFGAALCASTSTTIPKKKKKTSKSPIPTQTVESSITESTEELSTRTTLIICPLSVLSNWLDQFEQHVHADKKVNVYLYYGSERNKSPKFLSSQDVVITTYNVVSADFGNKSPLNGVNWLRVVLDEGHIIRNPDAQMSKAVLQLKAHRRWVLSGTPIQNSVKDLWMLLAFLRLKPFDMREWWNRVIQRPVTQGDRAGLQNLQNLVKCITLRRTKSSNVNGRPLVSLPEKTVFVEQVELSQEERKEYELARADGKNTIGRYVAEGTVTRNYADLLAILMRLRQHCCHPDLPRVFSELGASATPAKLRERLIEKLRVVLASGSDEECSVCLDSVRLPVITHCAHVYCRPCIVRVIGTERSAHCPLCRSEIKASKLVEIPPDESDDEDGKNSGRTSSKVQALMGNLLRLRSEDASIKSLVISQFTRFLTILETPLREHGFTFVRLDGTLVQKKRAHVVKEFQSAAADGPTIMLLSMKAGGMGLNLTAASRVFLMDPAWNPATEEQCIDRCHRLGQKKNVVVTKFIVKDSVEENMVKIQRQKQELVEKAFSSADDKSKSRIDDIRALLEL